MADPEYDRENQRRYVEELEDMTPAQFAWGMARETGKVPLIALHAVTPLTRLR